ncbi:hypothetical protein FSP39_000555 [Pinctada imbricata]|uniref:Laccase n=1 Tax=Pinctada imbricata TaxID=66713 RepID=A0AA89CCF0_PINIB|nr:hypothetical protein FSP39_000555 [Pinctada imbricata]
MHHPTLRAVYPHDGKLYRYDVTNTSAATPINVSEVIVADGFEGYKLVTIFNMTMPGPDIIVYEGQRLIITVENLLLSEAVTVHWHGLHQRGSPYMDGVPFVTQCPINPGSSFRYDFIAAPKGTFWYHSHMGGQRSDGAFGALIIRENYDSSIEDHIIQLQEWSHHYGTNLALRHWKGGRIVDRAFVRSPQTLDGSSLNFMHIDSALINGKGRYKSKETNDYNSTPLQVYNVRMGRQYRFRSINAGAGYPFRVSVDNHMLTIVATDGYDVRPMEYESFIIHPGERYDFILNASGPAANYWIRSQSLQVDKELIAWAILHYEGAPDEEPTSNSNRIPCTSSSKCYVLNCPYRYYPGGRAHYLSMT